MHYTVGNLSQKHVQNLQCDVNQSVEGVLQHPHYWIYRSPSKYKKKLMSLYNPTYDMILEQVSEVININL